MYIDDIQYKKIVEKTIIATVDIIFINHQNQILLGMRKNEPLQGVYYLPGGRRQKNETVNNSVIRKAQEEVGIKINPEKLIFLGVYDDIFTKSRYQDINTHCSSHTFIYKLEEKDKYQLKNDNQHSDLKYFDIDREGLHELIKCRVKHMYEKSFI